MARCLRWILLFALHAARPFLLGLKGPVSALLNLRAAARFYPHLRWLADGIRLLSGLAATALLSYALFIGYVERRLALPYLFGWIACAFLFALVDWIEDHATDPDVLRWLAGRAAERQVRRLVDAARRSFRGSRALHGQLFVFNEGAGREFSLEVDHILITRKHIYLIETKYKSGDIWAQETGPAWRVRTTRGDTHMRNALAQVHNAERVLLRELQLPQVCIPLVAIAGESTRIMSGPPNVCTSADLLEAIHAFEQGEPEHVLDTKQLAAIFQSFHRQDGPSVARHVARAQTAARRNP